MKVFIVRPFGKRRIPTRDKNTGEFKEDVIVNFDITEKDLILPALQQVGLDGGTTGEIFESGDIREDMFSLLLICDLVIADVSMHNATTN